MPIIIEVEQQVYIIKVSGVRFPFIYHYGVYINDNGNQVVYHCQLAKKNEKGGCIIETPFDEFMQGRKAINYFKTGLTKDEVLAKIDDIDDKKWTGLFFNCSDFTRRISKLSPIYTQKNYLIAALGLTAFLVLLNIKFKTQK